MSKSSPSNTLADSAKAVYISGLHEALVLSSGQAHFIPVSGACEGRRGRGGEGGEGRGREGGEGRGREGGEGGEGREEREGKGGRRGEVRKKGGEGRGGRGGEDVTNQD